MRATLYSAFFCGLLGMGCATNHSSVSRDAWDVREVMTARDWRYQDLDAGIRRLGTIPSGSAEGLSKGELNQKASAANLINLLNSGYRSRWWRHGEPASIRFWRQ